MCLHLPVFTVSQTGAYGPTPDPTLPWGPPQLQGPCGLTLPFWWPDTIWVQLKAQPGESRSEEGDTDPGKSGNKALSPHAGSSQEESPVSLAWSPEQAHHLFWRPADKPSASNPPFTCSSGDGGPFPAQPAGIYRAETL